jgi:hypothetical protein
VSSANFQTGSMQNSAPSLLMIPQQRRTNQPKCAVLTVLSWLNQARSNGFSILHESRPLGSLCLFLSGRRTWLQLVGGRLFK